MGKVVGVLLNVFTARVHLLGLIASFLCPVTEAKAMSGACYLDRAPGGCFERAMNQEREEQQAKQRLSEFLSLMEQTPPFAVPDFCHIAPDPKNGYATMAPPQNLTPSQMQICINAGNEWWAKKRQEEQDEELAYLKNARWRTFQADNGMRYFVDELSIRRLNNGNVTVNFVPVESNEASPAIYPMDVQGLIFDCRGHYQAVNGSISPTEFAPTGSVIGQIADFVCKAAPPAQ